jgi:hypothetical protein
MTPEEQAALVGALEGLAPSVPWFVLLAVALRGLHAWGQHVCKLLPQLIDIADRVSREGIRVRVELTDRDPPPDSSSSSSSSSS